MCERLFSQSHGCLPRVTTIMLVLGILCIGFSLPLAAYEDTSGYRKFDPQKAMDRMLETAQRLRNEAMTCLPGNLIRGEVVAQRSDTDALDTSALMSRKLTIVPSSACGGCGVSTLNYDLRSSSHREKQDYGGGYTMTTDYYVGQVVKGNQCLLVGIVYWIRITVHGGGQPATYSIATSMIKDGEISVSGTSYVMPKGSTFSGDFLGTIAVGDYACSAANHKITIQ